MSTIPEGLRADYMRQRMEDKATIRSIGGMYMGNVYAHTLPVYQGKEPITGYPTIQLSPSAQKYPLVAQWVRPPTDVSWHGGPTLIYTPIRTYGIQDGAINRSKIGDGGVVSPDLDIDTQYKLQIDKALVPATPLTKAHEALVIQYMDSSCNFDYDTMSFVMYKDDDIITKNRSGNSYVYRVYNPKVEFNNNTYYVVEYDNGDGDPKRCVHYSRISLKSNSTVTPETERTSSPYKNASLVTIDDEDDYPLTIYYGDRLTLSPVLNSGQRCFFAVDNDPAVYCHSTDNYHVYKIVTDQNISVAQYKVKDYQPIVYDEDGYPDPTLGTITSERIHSEYAHLPLESLEDGDHLCMGDSIQTTYTTMPYVRGSINYTRNTGSMGKSIPIDYGSSMTLSVALTYPGVEPANCFLYIEERAIEYTDGTGSTHISATATLVERDGQWTESVTIENNSGAILTHNMTNVKIRNSALLDSTSVGTVPSGNTRIVSASSQTEPTTHGGIYIIFKIGATYGGNTYYLRVPYSS